MRFRRVGSFISTEDDSLRIRYVRGLCRLAESFQRRARGCGEGNVFLFRITSVRFFPKTFPPLHSSAESSVLTGKEIR